VLPGFLATFFCGAVSSHCSDCCARIVMLTILSPEKLIMRLGKVVF